MRTDRLLWADKIHAAMKLANRIHHHQLRKDGEPYMLHVLRVATDVPPRAMAVALLHDVLEDGASWDDIDTVPLDPEEIVALRLLTRQKAMTYKEYILRMAEANGPGARIARTVKRADLRDNLRHSKAIEREHPDLVIRYDWAWGKLE